MARYVLFHFPWPRCTPIPDFATRLCRAHTGRRVEEAACTSASSWAGPSHTEVGRPRWPTPKAIACSAERTPGALSFQQSRRPRLCTYSVLSTRRRRGGEHSGGAGTRFWYCTTYHHLQSTCAPLDYWQLALRVSVSPLPLSPFPSRDSTLDALAPRFRVPSL